MGERYLIDTNALIEFQQCALPTQSQNFIASVIDTDFNISVINQMEILGSKHVTADTENFIALASVFELNVAIVKETINLRKLYRIKLPDAIIAATAIVNGLALVTHNVRDFNLIEGLRVVDSHTIS